MNFLGERRSNRTHESKTDPEAKPARKSEGKEAKLSYSGNLLVENRNGLIVNAMVWEANGTAERDTALVMLEQIPGQRRLTVGGDKGTLQSLRRSRLAFAGFAEAKRAGMNAPVKDANPVGLRLSLLAPCRAARPT